MYVPIILAAATSESASANLPLLLGLLGLAVAIVALVRVSSLKQELERPSSPQPQPSPAPAAKAPVAPPTAIDEGIPPEIIAVIAAAVAAVTGRSHRVLSIKPMSTSWERAGRQSVLTSHRIR